MNESKYLLFIKSESPDKISVNITDKGNALLSSRKGYAVKIIYIEKFRNLKSAMKKKLMLEKMSSKKIFKIAKEKNPELLNLAFTLYEL